MREMEGVTLTGLSATPFLGDKGGAGGPSGARDWRPARPRRASGLGAGTAATATSALGQAGPRRHVERPGQPRGKGVGARERPGPEAPTRGIAEIWGPPKSERGGSHFFLAETQVLEPTSPFSCFPCIFTFSAGAPSSKAVPSPPRRTPRASPAASSSCSVRTEGRGAAGRPAAPRPAPLCSVPVPEAVGLFPGAPPGLDVPTPL